MSRNLHQLLALLVIACPLWCAIADCGCCNNALKAESEPRCCCDHPPVPTENCPAPDSDQSQTCFCGGAILADVFQTDHDELSVLLFVPVAQQGRWNAFAVNSARLTIDPVESFPSGRMLRHLNMSLTL